MRRFLLAATIMICACSETPPAPTDLDDLAKQYLALELEMGNIDKSHVDAYFGPSEIKALAEESTADLDQIGERSDDLKNEVKALIAEQRSAPYFDPFFEQRAAGFLSRLQSLDMRIAINKGDEPRFDVESEALFMAIAPHHDAAHFDDILRQVDTLLPGEEPLSKRVDIFNMAFAIPADKLAVVFETAMAECRRRTLQHIEFPANESFTIEYVTDKPWSGYNWYQGDAVSVIQVNTDLPILIHRAVDLGCHEGYPGHHTFNALLEKNLVVDKGWLEYSLYPLFSAQSVIAEGSGNYGIELAFPGNERRQFEEDVLFPISGLDTGGADSYYALQELLRQLNYADNEAARAYLNGEFTREQAVDWLMKYSLASRKRAEQRTRFFDSYRSYVINYNHGKDLVSQFIERDDADATTRWARFETMLSSPVLPSDLED